jgi:hypothetical protein
MLVKAVINYGEDAPVSEQSTGNSQKDLGDSDV